MEKTKKPGFFKMIRAPFLSSIFAPLLAGIFLTLSIKGQIDIAAAFIVLVIGVGLHIATNVYNDIYDTIQGTDKVNVHRNESSGGSGVLLDFPELMPKMFFIARTALFTALAGTIALTLLIDRKYWPYLWILYLVSAFFSKYYTAPPVKLAYRGWGEISVWLAFGPMAVLIATVSQNIGFYPQVILLMPATGLSTLSILLVGQLIDVDADKKGGKHGVASRLGTRTTSVLYLFVQITIVLNILALFLWYPGTTWPLLFALIPYLFLFPKAAKIVLQNHDNEDELKKGAKLTVLTHILFSLLIVAGLVIYYFIN